MERGNRSEPALSICKMDRLPPCKWLSFLFPLAFPIEVQSLDDGILNLLRRRPRRKILADTLLWNFELFLLVGLVSIIFTSIFLTIHPKRCTAR